MTLGEVIKNYRAEHNCSMDAFAAASGLSKAYISMLEKNENPKTKAPITPSIVTFGCAAMAMNISLDALLSMVDENQPVYVSVDPKTGHSLRMKGRVPVFHSDKKIRLSCKIDSELYDDLAISAEGNNRTLEDEIEDRLYWSIQEEIDQQDNHSDE
ncbi:MAG: helix-turn-helix domain-containing protein [Clostridiales bacterium]|nr:helix-turn-helix domain-containing protein [Clostridiales bacterium]